MAFLNGLISFRVYSDSSETEFPQELIPSISKEFENSEITEIQATTVVLAAAGSQTISFNSVGTVKRWYLYSSAADLTLNVNGLGSSITYQSMEPGYIPMTLSSLVITNASASVSTTVTLVMIAS